MRLSACLLILCACEPGTTPTPQHDLAKLEDLSSSDFSGNDLSTRDLAVPTFSVGGMVSGLNGTLVIRDNGGDDLTLTMDGAFTFAKKVADGSNYTVTVATQPAGQRCDVTAGSGKIMGADVSNVMISCQNVHTISGMVSGMVFGTLILQDNGGDDLVINYPNDTFTFDTPVAEGADYAITISAQPTGQLCTVSAAGTIGTSDINDVLVTCHKLAVRIDEIYPHVGSGVYGDTNGDGLRDSGDDEFIEIQNLEPQAVDVSGWVLKTGSTLTTKYTFPASTMLMPGQRAVVFGGGTPTGGFGGALVAVASSLSLADGGGQASLESLGTNGLVLDMESYPNLSCSPQCRSYTRDSAGNFTDHISVSGLLWSPGTAPTQAIPKFSPNFSTPAGGASNVSVIGNLIAQFNLFMNAAGFTNANIKLYASTCAAPANEVTLASIVSGSDTSQAVITPASTLSFSTTYCVTLDGSLESSPSPTPSPSPVTLGAMASWQFSTRAAASSPANSMVISEVGGCRMASGTGSNPCTGTSTPGNDEFVELYNASGAAVDVSGWFIQRRTAGGTASCWASIPSPAPLVVPPGGFFLVGGAGYDFTHYLDASPSPSPDFMGGGTTLTGTSESVVLIDKNGTCTGSTSVVDSVSYGTITDTATFLHLPAFPSSPARSLERKACWNSTGDSDPSTGLFSPGGGHVDKGNGERLGASNSDWVLRPTPEPQSSQSSTETGMCSS